MFCCIWTVGCQKFGHYIPMLYPGRFILVESVVQRTVVRPYSFRLRAVASPWSVFRSTLRWPASSIIENVQEIYDAL